MSLKPYCVDDLEDILGDIRGRVMSYKKNKHEMSAVDMQDIRDDLAILRFQLADIGADLYGWKIESASKYENDRLKREEEVETELNALTKKGDKQVNVADRAKRRAKLDISADEMNRNDKLNKLAINLYQHALPDLLNSIASHIAVKVRYNPDDVQRKGEPARKEDNGFEQWENYEKRVFKGAEDLQNEVNRID
jgi:hypothetical protein